MTCRVIVELNFNDNMREKALEKLREHCFPATKDSEGFINIDFASDKDNPNRMFITETWETKEDHLKYLNWRMEEDPTKMFPSVLDMGSEGPKMSWSEVVYTPS